MEPLTILEPQDNFVHKVRELCNKHNALLVFDEVITGFRFSNGGAQELLGVTPDLATFAKGISNGIPLSAITGKKEYMFALEKTFFSFTYGGECLGLAAASASIDKIVKNNVPKYLAEIGQVLQDGFNAIAESHKVSDLVSCVGYPQRSVISLNGSDEEDTLQMKSFIQQELLRRGVLWTAYHATSYAHSSKDIEITLNAYNDSLEMLSKLYDGPGSLKAHIEGIPVRPVFRKVSDFNSFIQQKGKV